LIRRSSHTKTEELYEQADLARYLWALSREQEALEILRSVTAAIPAPPPFGRDREPNMNIWSPVVSMHAMEVRLYRRVGKPERSEAAAARVVAHPGLPDNHKFIIGKVLRAPIVFREAEAETLKWACYSISRTIGRLIHLRELAIAGHRYGSYFDPEFAEGQIIEGRARLAEKLAAAT
jgi:hypothetical protein